MTEENAAGTDSGLSIADYKLTITGVSNIGIRIG